MLLDEESERWTDKCFDAVCISPGYHRIAHWGESACCWCWTVDKCVRLHSRSGYLLKWRARKQSRAHVIHCCIIHEAIWGGGEHNWTRTHTHNGLCAQAPYSVENSLCALFSSGICCVENVTHLFANKIRINNCNDYPSPADTQWMAERRGGTKCEQKKRETNTEHYIDLHLRFQFYKIYVSPCISNLKCVNTQTGTESWTQSTSTSRYCDRLALTLLWPHSQFDLRLEDSRRHVWRTPANGKMHVRIFRKTISRRTNKKLMKLQLANVSHRIAYPFHWSLSHSLQSFPMKFNALSASHTHSVNKFKFNHV